MRVEKFLRRSDLSPSIATLSPIFAEIVVRILKAVPEFPACNTLAGLVNPLLPAPCTRQSSAFG